MEKLKRILKEIKLVLSKELKNLIRVYRYWREIRTRKQAISGTDKIILEFIEAMGLKGDLVRDMKITIPLDGAVTLEVEMFADRMALRKGLMVLKKFELTEKK